MDKNTNSVNISINEKYLKGIEKFDIISIFGKDNLEEIQNIISAVTGIAFITVDYKGEPVTQATNFTGFCTKMRQNEKQVSLCKLSDATGSIIAATNKQTSIYFCPCGLLEVAIPIIVNERYLGGFIGGQVICKDAPQSVMRLSKNMVEGGSELINIDVNSPNFQKEYTDSKVYSYREFVSISRLVELIMNQLTKQELISGHNKMKNLNRISELEEKLKKAEYENDVLNSKINNLQRNINAFFVRNTVNIISNLSILEGAQRTNDAILKYANFIESELNLEKDYTISSELQRVEKFIEINKIRYQDRLHYRIDFDNDLLNKKVPFPFILPIVHASIYYSLTGQENNYKLKIKIYKTGKDVNVVVEDNGPAFTLQELENKYKIYGENHEGCFILKSIAQIEKAMLKFFKEKCQMKVICEKGKGTKTTVIYPIKYDEGL